MSFGALRLAFFAVTALLLGASTRIPGAQWLDALEAQRHGQLPLLLARAGCFGMLLLVAPALRAKERVPLVALALALCTASLAWNAAAIPFAIVVAVASLRVRGHAPAARALGFVALLVVAPLAVGVALGQRAPAKATLPTDARGLALYWEGRDNPFRALFFARQWARSEPELGEGALCVARMALRLGDVDDARGILRDIGARAPAETIRAEAHALLEQSR